MGGFKRAYLWGVEMKYEITKGSEKDFHGAPDWALFVSTCSTGIYWEEAASQVKGNRYQHSDSDNLENYTGNCGGKKLCIIAERRPIAEPVWDSEGLPPVGVECEFTSSSSGDVWHAGVVRYLSEHTIVIEFTDMVNGKAESISHPRTMKFRPLRSTEDVARDEEIVLLTDVICGKMPDVGVATAAMFAGRVYDAGYRRPKPHADEVVACKHESTRPSAGGCICNDCGWRSW